MKYKIQYKPGANMPGGKVVMQEKRLRLQALALAAGEMVERELADDQAAALAATPGIKVEPIVPPFAPQAAEPEPTPEPTPEPATLQEEKPRKKTKKRGEE